MVAVVRTPCPHGNAGTALAEADHRRSVRPPMSCVPPGAQLNTLRAAPDGVCGFQLHDSHHQL